MRIVCNPFRCANIWNNKLHISVCLRKLTYQIRFGQYADRTLASRVHLQDTWQIQSVSAAIIIVRNNTLKHKRLNCGGLMDFYDAVRALPHALTFRARSRMSTVAMSWFEGITHSMMVRSCTKKLSIKLLTCQKVMRASVVRGSANTLGRWTMIKVSRVRVSHLLDHARILACGRRAYDAWQIHNGQIWDIWRCDLHVDAVSAEVPSSSAFHERVCQTLDHCSELCGTVCM